jgi:hypothetical protein
MYYECSWDCKIFFLEEALKNPVSLGCTTLDYNKSSVVTDLFLFPNHSTGSYDLNCHGYIGFLQHYLIVYLPGLYCF